MIVPYFGLLLLDLAHGAFRDYISDRFDPSPPPNTEWSTAIPGAIGPAVPAPVWTTPAPKADYPKIVPASKIVYERSSRRPTAKGGLPLSGVWEPWTSPNTMVEDRSRPPARSKSQQLPPTRPELMPSSEGRLPSVSNSSPWNPYRSATPDNDSPFDPAGALRNSPMARNSPIARTPQGRSSGYDNPISQDAGRPPSMIMSENSPMAHNYMRYQQQGELPPPQRYGYKGSSDSSISQRPDRRTVPYEPLSRLSTADDSDDRWPSQESSKQPIPPNQGRRQHLPVPSTSSQTQERIAKPNNTQDRAGYSRAIYDQLPPYSDPSRIKTPPVDVYRQSQSPDLTPSPFDLDDSRGSRMSNRDSANPNSIRRDSSPFTSRAASYPTNERIVVDNDRYSSRDPTYEGWRGTANNVNGRRDTSARGANTFSPQVIENQAHVGRQQNVFEDVSPYRPGNLEVTPPYRTGGIQLSVDRSSMHDRPWDSDQHSGQRFEGRFAPSSNVIPYANSNEYSEGSFANEYLPGGNSINRGWSF